MTTDPRRNRSNWKYRYPASIKVSLDARKRLNRYKGLTGYDIGKQIDYFIEKISQLSSNAIKVLTRWHKVKGESPRDHIDRLLNEELGLKNWGKDD